MLTLKHYFISATTGTKEKTMHHVPTGLHEQIAYFVEGYIYELKQLLQHSCRLHLMGLLRLLCGRLHP